MSVFDVRRIAARPIPPRRSAVHPGRGVAPPPGDAGYLGFIFARGRALAKVVASLRNALQRLEFKLRPEVSLHASRDG